MTYVQRAIEKAIEGGYEKGKFFVDYHHINQLDDMMMQGQFLLDPEFWKCLGEAKEMFTFTWLYSWHCLIDHIAEGGTVEEYFEKILKQ